MNTTGPDATNGTPARPRKATTAAASSVAGGTPTSHSEFDALVADAQDLVNSTIDVVSGQTAAARAKLQSTIASTKERLASGAAALGDHGREAAGVVDDAVRGWPWQAMSVAALAGVIVGVLVARR